MQKKNPYICHIMALAPLVTEEPQNILESILESLQEY